MFNPKKSKIMKIITLIKQIVSRIKSPVYRLFYVKELNGEADVYYLQNPKFDRNWFGNQVRGIERKGFRAYALNRQAFRSFNYEGIINIQKVGLLETLN
jgi:hypothetical protein